MLSDTDLELLSAYLDGALNPSERAALETRLQTEPELRRELARLQATVDLVRALPPLAAPRDFRLTPRQAQQARQALPARRPVIWTSAAFSALSAAAAVILLVIGVSLFRLPSSELSNSAVPNQVAVLATVAQAPDAQTLGEEDDETMTSSIVAATGTQSAQEPPQESPQESRDLAFAAPTGTPMPTQVDAFAARQSSETASAPGVLADNLSEAAADQAQLELQQAAPSAASGAGAVEAPLPFAAALASTETPSETSTKTPSPTETPRPTDTPTPAPSPTAIPTFAPTPPAPAAAPDQNTVAAGLIVLALILGGVALVTTLTRLLRGRG